MAVALKLYKCYNHFTCASLRLYSVLVERCCLRSAPDISLLSGPNKKHWKIWHVLAGLWIVIVTKFNSQCLKQKRKKYSSRCWPPNSFADHIIAPWQLQNCMASSTQAARKQTRSTPLFSVPGGSTQPLGANTGIQRDMLWYDVKFHNFKGSAVCNDKESFGLPFS